MAKASLKLSGSHEAWAAGVRSGILTRADGAEQPVFVRPLVAFGPEAVEPLREEARLVARINVRGVLRVEYGTTLQGKPAVVYQAAPVASLTVIRAQLRERGLTLPVRAAVQLAAELAHTLNDLLASSVEGVRYAHPGFGDEDVLVDVNGGVYLAGVRALRDNALGMLPVAPCVPPTSLARSDAATYAVAVLLYQVLAESPFLPPPVGGPAHEEHVKKALMKVRARAGDAPSEDVLQVLRKMLSADPAVRGGVGAAATRLEQLGAADRGVSLAAWAPAFVSTVGSVLPAAPRPTAKRQMPEPPPAATFSDEEGTHRLRPVVNEADETMRLRASEPEPVFGLPPPPSDRVKPVPATAPMMMDDPKPQRRTPASGPELRPGPSLGPVAPHAPSGPAIGPAIGPRPPEMRAEAMEATHRMPSVAAAPSPAPAPRPASGPAMPSPKMPIAIEPAPPPAVRSGPSAGVVGTVVAAVAIGGMAVIAVLVLAWQLLDNEPDVVATQAVPEAVIPGAEPTEASPAAAAATEAAPEPKAAEAAGEKAGKPAKPEAKTDAAAPARPTPSAPIAAPTATPEPEPSDDTPARIVASPKAAAEPAATPAPAATTPASTGPFRVEFRSGDPTITDIEARCPGGGGSGASVVVPSTPAGSCRVKGTGVDAAIVTQVSVSADRTYTCFAGGSRTCR